MAWQRLICAALGLLALIPTLVKCDSACKVYEYPDHTDYSIWVDMPYKDIDCDVVSAYFVYLDETFDDFACMHSGDGNTLILGRDRQRNGVNVNLAMKAAFPENWNDAHVCPGGWENVATECFWGPWNAYGYNLYSLTIDMDVHAGCVSARTRLQDSLKIQADRIDDDGSLYWRCYYDEDTQHTYMYAAGDLLPDGQDNNNFVSEGMTEGWADGAALLGLNITCRDPGEIDAARRRDQSTIANTSGSTFLEVELPRPRHTDNNRVASEANTNCTYKEFGGHSRITAYIAAPYDSGHGCGAVEDTLINDKDLSVSNYECEDPGDGTTRLKFDDRIKNGHNVNLALQTAYPDYWGEDTCDSGYQGIHAECTHRDDPNTNSTYYTMAIDWDLQPCCSALFDGLQSQNFDLATKGRDYKGEPMWQCFTRSGGTTGKQTVISATGKYWDPYEGLGGLLVEAWEMASIYGLDFGGCTRELVPCDSDNCSKGQWT